MHAHSLASVIILVIDHMGIASLKHEGDAPVSADTNRPNTLAVTAQGMQEQARQVHIFRRGCGMKTRQNQAQSPGVFRLDTRFAAGQEEALQPLVLEALDHEPDRNLSGYRAQVESIASSTGTDGRFMGGTDRHGIERRFIAFFGDNQLK